MLIPLIKIFPSYSSYNPANILMRELFPAPLAPTITVGLLTLNSTLISRRTLSWPLYEKFKFSTVIFLIVSLIGIVELILLSFFSKNSKKSSTYSLSLYISDKFIRVALNLLLMRSKDDM